MPKYVYRCEYCDISIEVIHSIGEIPHLHCPKCFSGSLVRDYNQPFSQIKKENSDGAADISNKLPVGELTKKYIEENREILRELKEDMKK